METDTEKNRLRGPSGKEDSKFFRSDLHSRHSRRYFAAESEAKPAAPGKTEASNDLRCSCGRKIAEISGDRIVIGHRGCPRLTVVRYNEAERRFEIERN